MKSIIAALLSLVLGSLLSHSAHSGEIEPPMEQALSACSFAGMQYTAIAETYSFDAETIESTIARERYIEDFTKLYSLFGSVTPDLMAVLLDSYDAGIRSARSSLKLLERTEAKADRDRRKRAWFKSADELQGACMFMLGRMDARGQLTKVLARSR